MSQFITIKRSDPDFSSYLTGRFSSQQRAIPVRGFRSSSASEESFTFELQNVNSLDRPHALIVFLRLIRWPLLTLTVMPAVFTALVVRPVTSHFVAYEYILAFLALICFHCSLFAWNDYRDHIYGWDLYFQKAGTRTIQRGHLAAFQVKQIAWAALAFSVIFAVPVLWGRWYVLGFPLFAFLFAASISLFRGYPKLKIFMTQVTVFFCFGPLLIYGAAFYFLDFQIQDHNIIFTMVSVLFGLAALLYMHARQFSHLMLDDRSDAMTLAVHLGFDRMKRFLVLELTLLMIGVLVFLILLRFSPWSWLTVIPLLLWLPRLMDLTRRCGSPVSSSISRLPGYYLGTHWLLSLWLIAEALL